VSIFVNPRQFNVAEDFTKYPIRSLRPCHRESEGVDIAFAPTPGDLPPGSTLSYRSVLSRVRSRRRGRVTSTGRHRRGILFGLVGAEHAYFGQKDAQQVMVIRQMARDLLRPWSPSACASPMGSLVAKRPLSPADGPPPRSCTASSRRAPLGGRRAIRRGAPA
jgi:pantothenate synthetase